MPLWRLRFSVTCLATASLALTGCGGGHKKTAPSSKPVTTRASTPIPVLDVTHVRTSLLKPAEIASNLKPQPPTFPGLTEGAVPSCSVSTIPLPGAPKTISRQLETSSKGYTGAHYIQLVAVYPDIASASEAAKMIRTRVRACPAKRHFPEKKLGGRRFAIAHDDIWTVTESTIGGWTHIRGFEKHVEPPSTSIYNVFYDVYDYAIHGNVVLTSLYWERVKPSVSGDTIAKKATGILNRQLPKIG